MTAVDVNVVTVDAVTAAVIVDAGADVLPAVIVDDADASAVVTTVVTVNAIL